jgi:ferrous iron transport protein A
MAALPLSMMNPGAEAVIESIRAGHGLRRRLAEMGLIPGVGVRMIQNHMPGPVCVEAKGCKLCLGHGIAHRIFVSPGDLAEKRNW